MALNSNAIVTLVEAKVQMNVVDSSLDTTLETWINYCSSIVEEYTHNKFAVQSISDEIRGGNGRAKLRPLYAPIVQLSTETTPTNSQKLASVQYRENVESSWQDIEDDVRYIVLNNPLPRRVTEQTSYNIELLRKVFPLGKQNIKISYKAGFSTVPSDIKRVVLEMVQDWYNMHKGGGDALGKSNVTQSQQSGNYNTTWIDLNPRWAKILDRYRIVQV